MIHKNEKDERTIIDGISVKPCVGCGYCCITTPCYVSRRIYGDGIEGCPELEWIGTRYICKLCNRGTLSERYKEELFIGAGCCSNLNSWRKDVKPRKNENIIEENLVTLDPIFQKFLFCLGKEMISGDKVFLILSSLERILLNENKPEKEVKSILTKIVSILKDNRSNFTNSFMGSIKC